MSSRGGGAADPPEPAAGAGVELGRVARSRGMDGTLLVVLHGDDPANLTHAVEVTLQGGPGEIPFRVVEAAPASPTRDGRARVNLRLAGLDVRDDAEPWQGASVTILESTLRPLPEGEYYWRDLIGLECRLGDGTALGRIDEIWPTGANDVLVVGTPGDPILIPALDEVLVRVDRAAGLVVVEPPEGLLDPQPRGD